VILAQRFNNVKNRQSFYIVFPIPFGNAAVIYTDKSFLILNVLLPQKHKKELVKIIKKNWLAKAGAHPDALKIAEIIKENFKGTAN